MTVSKAELRRLVEEELRIVLQEVDWFRRAFAASGDSGGALGGVGKMTRINTRDKLDRLKRDKPPVRDAVDLACSAYEFELFGVEVVEEAFEKIAQIIATVFLRDLKKGGVVGELIANGIDCACDDIEGGAAVPEGLFALDCHAAIWAKDAAAPMIKKALSVFTVPNPVGQDISLADLPIEQMLACILVELGICGRYHHSDEEIDDFLKGDELEDLGTIEWPELSEHIVRAIIEEELKRVLNEEKSVKRCCKTPR